MELKIQVYSFVVSFIYGLFFYLMLGLHARIIYSSFILVKVVGSLLFVIVMSLLYFIMLLYINNGYVHLYFFLCIMLGYFVCKLVKKKIVKW